MNTSIQFGPDDRDERGFVKVPARPPEPRSLADLLPTPEAIRADAQPKKRTATKAEIASAIAALAVALLLAGIVFWRGGDAPPAAPRRPAAAAAPTGDAVLTPSPLPAPAPAMAGRVLIAFAAPDGQPLGAIESTRAITPTAHYGSAWIQADVAGSGRVWLRASDAPSLAIVGPDLAPPPTRTPAPPPPATATPEPPPCLTAGVGAQVVTVCGWGDLASEARAKWLATYGGNPGIVTTPTPYGGNP